MRVRQLRPTSSLFWVDVRLVRLDGKWLASADTAVGPSLGLGRLPHEALIHALQPFDGVVDEPMDTVPDELLWASS